MSSGRVRAAAVAVACSASLLGCSSGAKLAGPTTISPTTTRPVPLPPRDTGALVKVVAPLIPADDEIQRVYLDVGDSPESSVMLSIYVRPRGQRSADEYARRLAPLAKQLIPVLFSRYPGVRAIDLCQELPNDVTQDDSPPPVTRVLIFREDAASIDWSTFDLSTVRRLARGEKPKIQLQLTAEVLKSPAFVAAKDR